MDVYDRLEEIDASTAEVRASAILRGLGFTHAMMNKQAKDFSGVFVVLVVLCKRGCVAVNCGRVYECFRYSLCMKEFLHAFLVRDFHDIYLNILFETM
jgi:hypothetical protein